MMLQFGLAPGAVTTEEQLMTHRYKAGDKVRLAFGFHDQDAIGTYDITALLPTRTDGVPQYRVRGGDGRERVIGEEQIGEPGKPGTTSHPESKPIR